MARIKVKMNKCETTLNKAFKEFIISKTAAGIKEETLKSYNRHFITVTYLFRRFRRSFRRRKVVVENNCFSERCLWAHRGEAYFQEENFFNPLLRFGEALSLLKSGFDFGLR